MSDTQYLTADEVLELHDAVEEHARKYLESEGKDASQANYGLRAGQRPSLESAVARPATNFGEEVLFETIPEKVAALTHGLTQNHCFINGNKRTALLAAVKFLERNGFELVLTKNQARRLDYYWQANDVTVDSLLAEDFGDDTKGFILMYLYAIAFRGMQTFLSDPSDDEIAWDKLVSARDDFEVPWNESVGEFEVADLDLDQGLQTHLAEAAGRYRTYLIGKILFSIFRGVYGVSNGQDLGYLIPKDFGFESLPEDEQAVATAAVTSPIIVGDSESYWEIESEGSVIERASVYFDGNLDPDKTEVYEEIIGRFADREFVPEGLGIEIEDQESGETHEAKLFLEVWPMVTEGSRAFFPIKSHIYFSQGELDFDNFSEEELKELNDSLMEIFDDLVDDAHETLLELETAIASSTGDALEEIAEDLPDDVVASNSLDAPDLVVSGSYEPMWRFICRIDTEDLSIEEIASWFEERMRPLKDSVP